MSLNTLSDLSIILLLVTFSGCIDFDSPPREPGEGTLIEGVYRNERFGMTMTVPDDWELLSVQATEAVKEKGSELSKREFGDKAADSWQELLNIRKKGSAIHQFSAYYMTYKPSLSNLYSIAKQQRFLGTKQILESNPGVEVEAVRTITEIDGVSFDTYNMRMLKEGREAGFQIMFEKKYDNNEILIMSITTSDLETLEAFRPFLEAAKFDRKQ